MTDRRPGNLRVVVVGAGYVAQHHLEALSQLSFVDVVALVDIDAAAARKLAASHGVETVVTSLDEVAALEPDAAYILTPPDTHCALALQALALGCHVLVEKPMAETVEDCAAMVEAAAQRNRVLSVNHSDLFDPVVSRALALARSGACGDVMVVDVLRSSDYPAYAGGRLPAPVRQGSYPFRDLGTHGLYLIEAFLGPIRSLEVGYRATGQNPGLAFDEWHALATCERGIGRLQLSWNVRPIQSRVIVQGTRGVVEVDRFLQVCRSTRVLPGPKFIGTVWSGFRNAAKEALQIPYNVVRYAVSALKPSPGIRIASAAFARALHEGRPPPVDAADGARIVALMDRACRAADALQDEALASRLAPLEPADALVTGGGGFVGSALVRRLRESGSRVRVLVRRPQDWMRQDPGIQVVVGNLGDPEVVSHAVRDVDVVYHVGAAMRGDASEFSAGTVWGTRNVIRACLEQGVRRLVHVSSLGVLDHAGAVPDAPVTEESPLEPHAGLRGHYTQSKLDAERLVLDAIRDEGLPAVIVRPGQIFGPGAERVAPNGVVALGRWWIAVGPAAQAIPLVYVDDVVSALLAAASNADAAGRLFHVVDPIPYRQDRYLAAVRRHFGREIRVIRLPAFIFRALAAGVELLGRILRRNVPLTRYRARSLRPLSNVRSDLAREILGWQAEVGVDAGMARTFRGA